MSRNPLYVGIDFSRKRVQVAVLDAEGRALGHSRSIPNTYVGYQQVKGLLQEHVQREGAGRLVIAGEATSYYWLPYFQQFACDPFWKGMELAPYLLNARWVRWFKKGRSPTHKDDDIDAEEIGQYVRIQPPSTVWQYDEHWLSLRLLTRLRFHLTHSLTREKNLAQLYLFLLRPSYTAHHPFANVFGATSQQLLTAAEGTQGLEDLPVEELAAALQELSGDRLPNPGANAQDLQEEMRDRFPLPEGLRIPTQKGLHLLIETIRHLQIQIKQVDALITQRVQGDEYAEVGYLQSIPGLGPVLASGIATEIGHLTRFSEPLKWDKHRRCQRQRNHREVNDAVHKYAGWWWRHHQSGEFTADERHLSREGNPYLRYFLIQAAECMRLHIPSFASYYQQKKAQATHHAHKRALVLTASKVLDLCVTLLQREENYRAKEETDPST